MSGQAEVHSIEALKDFRAALALYGEDALAALGAVEAEIRRTIAWLHQDRPVFWLERIKRLRERVASAKSDLFRLSLQKTPEHHPSLGEAKERLRLAQAALADAEKRLTLVRKWQPALQQAILEYHGSVQRLKDLTSIDTPRAVAQLARLIEALEAYLQIQPPAGAPGDVHRPALEAIAVEILEEERDEPDAGEVAESRGLEPKGSIQHGQRQGDRGGDSTEADHPGLE